MIQYEPRNSNYHDHLCDCPGCNYDGTEPTEEEAQQVEAEMGPEPTDEEVLQGMGINIHDMMVRCDECSAVVAISQAIDMGSHIGPDLLEYTIYECDDCTLIDDIDEYP